MVTISRLKVKDGSLTIGENTFDYKTTDSGIVLSFGGDDVMTLAPAK